MRIDTRAVAFAALVVVTPAIVVAQSRPSTAQSPSKDEIKLDESTALKAAALEARASALLANLALMQRQAQDMQQELQKILDERKTLIQDAAKKVNVEVKEPLEWALDNKGQRYQRVVRPSPPAR